VSWNGEYKRDVEVWKFTSRLPHFNIKTDEDVLKTSMERQWYG
jgi:hypothetical protein